MKDYPFVDSHVHTFPTAALGLAVQGGAPRLGYDGTVEHLLSMMGKAGAEKAILVNVLPTEGMKQAALARLPRDYREGRGEADDEEMRVWLVGRMKRMNEWSCQLAREHPGLVPWINIGPIMDEAAIREEVLDKVQRHGARGIKIHPELQGFHPNDRRMWPLYRLAQDMDLPLVSHCGASEAMGFPGFSDARYFFEVMESFPRLRLRLAHLAMGFWDDALRLARKYPGVVFDTAVVVTQPSAEGGLSDQELVARIRAVGADRVMYGSDYPFGDAERDRERILRLPLTQEEKRLVLGENARRLYGI